METVADVLDRKYPQFNTVSPECKVSDALYQMSCENVDHLIVLENEKFLGLLTDHDIASKVLFAENPLNKIPVREFMTRTLPVAALQDSLEYCLQIMEMFHAKHLAVYDNFDFKGVVCAQDLLEEALNIRKTTFSGNKFERKGYPWNY
jgi:CBS domain-containing protein